MADKTGSYEDALQLVGEVRQADLDTQQFGLLLPDGKRMTLHFPPSFEEAVVEALSKHVRSQLRVTAQGEFAVENGKLERILEVKNLEVLENESPSRASEPHILKKILELAQSVPPEAWDNFPSDVASNIDYYLDEGFDKL